MQVLSLDFLTAKWLPTFEMCGGPEVARQKAQKFVLTWIVFGMNLLWPVSIEGDSVLCCSTGTAVKQRFICRISINGLYTEMRGWKKQGKCEKARNTENHETEIKTGGVMGITKEMDGLRKWGARERKGGVGELGHEKRGRCAGQFFWCHSVWHPIPCTARGYTHLQPSTCHSTTAEMSPCIKIKYERK